jgi:hypothetical protein
MLVRRGESRVVIRVGPWVLKVAQGLNGVACNLIEWSTWRRTGHPRLVPTRWTLLGMVNCQPYAGPTVASATDEQVRVAGQLGILDPTAANIVESSAGWAICDYGFSEAICRLWCGRAACGCYGEE